MITKTCTKCGETKPLDGFHKHPDGQHGRSSRCKTCVNARQKELRIKKLQGIDLATFDEPLADGQCAYWGKDGQGCDKPRDPDSPVDMCRAHTAAIPPGKLRRYGPRSVRCAHCQAPLVESNQTARCAECSNNLYRGAHRFRTIMAGVIA